MNEQILQLEVKLAYLEAAVEELTQTVVRQQQMLHDTGQQLGFIRSLLAELHPAAVRPLDQETPPPHY